MPGRRVWLVRAAAVAAMAGAALVLPVRADARPDPGGPWGDLHDCNGGFVYEPGYFDHGPISDLFHHNLEQPLMPLLGTPIPVPFGLPPTEIDIDPHYSISCHLLARNGL